ncbi:Platelet-activating factor acetylhydrolase [Penicillium alfredii]|uniref:Platelet-activating factor acetylhydrolase n=1 Tax=Penicillium alfredii TaxID=1506179 RepID=A0A9W9GB66_9EURO|nr:Platelet-activating factor acetylhydrolase [Penicillium alfredii]KAJ5115478.1 Platelet-activating factor acetylhydrolase [Penicillium alfredii]
MYTVLLQDIASNGFAVVSVDHPYDADIVEYPDDRTVLGTNITTNTEFLLAQNVRVKDMSFVLDQIQDENAVKGIFPLSKGNSNLLSLDRVSLFGLGSTAAQTILVDDRFVGGINLDGALWGSVVNIGLSKPFLLFGHTNYTQATDATWKKFWSKIARMETGARARAV